MKLLGVRGLTVAALLVIAAVAWMVFANCCLQRTVVSGGRQSPSGRYTTWVWAYGAYGRAFTDITAKTLYVCVSELSDSSSTKSPKREMTLYERTLKVTAGHMWWESHWSGDTNVVIELCDYGEMESITARESGLSPKWQKQIRLYLDADGKHFLEYNPTGGLPVIPKEH